MFIKIKLVKNRATYYPRPKNDTYYGVFFSIDEEHITIKSIKADIEGNLVYGIIDRFVLADVEVKCLDIKTLDFTEELSDKKIKELSHDKTA